MQGIRKTHPAFRQRYFFEGRHVHDNGPKDLAWIAPDGSEVPTHMWQAPDVRTLGMFIAGDLIDGTGGHIRDDSFLVLMHSGAAPTEFVLPGPPYGSTYVVVLDTWHSSHVPAITLKAGDTQIMQPYSLQLLRVCG